MGDYDADHRERGLFQAVTHFLFRAIVYKTIDGKRVAILNEWINVNDNTFQGAWAKVAKEVVEHALALGEDNIRVVELSLERCGDR